MAVWTIFQPFKPQYLPGYQRPPLLPFGTDVEQSGLKIFYAIATLSRAYMKHRGGTCTNVDSSFFHRRCAQQIWKLCKSYNRVCKHRSTHQEIFIRATYFIYIYLFTGILSFIDPRLSRLLSLLDNAILVKILFLRNVIPTFTLIIYPAEN